MAIEDDLFRAILLDFQKLVLPMADMGVHLAGRLWRNEPEIDDECIAFNGPDDCGRPPYGKRLIESPRQMRFRR